MIFLKFSGIFRVDTRLSGCSNIILQCCCLPTSSWIRRFVFMC